MTQSRTSNRVLGCNCQSYTDENSLPTCPSILGDCRLRTSAMNTDDGHRLLSGGNAGSRTVCLSEPHQTPLGYPCCPQVPQGLGSSKDLRKRLTFHP